MFTEIQPRRSGRKRNLVNYAEYDQRIDPLFVSPPKRKRRVVLRVGQKRVTLANKPFTERPVNQVRKRKRHDFVDYDFDELRDGDWDPSEEKMSEEIVQFRSTSRREDEFLPPCRPSRMRSKRLTHNSRSSGPPPPLQFQDLQVTAESQKRQKQFTVRRSNRKRKAVQYTVIPDDLEMVSEKRAFINRLKVGDQVLFKKTKKAIRTTNGSVVNIFYHYTLEYHMGGTNHVFTGILTHSNSRMLDMTAIQSFSPTALRFGTIIRFLCKDGWVEAKISQVEKEFAISHFLRKKPVAMCFTDEMLMESVILPHMVKKETKETPSAMPAERKVETILFREYRQSLVTGQMTEYFYIKLEKRAYVHCEWVTEEEVVKCQGGRKLKNFRDRELRPQHQRMKQRVLRLREKGVTSDKKLPYFNLDFLRIDLIFDQCIDDMGQTLFRVKWGSLSMDQATWEKADFLRSCENFSEALRMYKIQESIPPPYQLYNGSIRRNRGPPLPIDRNQIFKGKYKLKSYQVRGVEWLIHNYHAYTPCILADEMGLGKTVQTISFLEYLANQKDIRGPTLIVAPLSTLGHWQREFRAWTDINVVLYHGNQDTRAMIQQELFYWNHAPAEVNRYNTKFNVLLTTNQIALKDFNALSGIHWENLIVDEAHSLKSPASQVYQRLFSFKKNHCILLTGTPIQNNMQELWSLLHFLDPSEFQSEKLFVTQFGKDNLSSTNGELRKKILNPRLLQRSKALVEPDLLTREEKVIWVELTLLQKKWYKALYEQNYEKLANIGGNAATKTSLMNISMQLRKCCNHPFLLRGCEESVSPVGTTWDNQFRNLVAASGKLVLLDKLLPKLRMEGHRVLIFSQMSKMLDIIEEYLRGSGYDLERIDGSVTGSRRQEAIDRFQQNDDCFAFLLTTRAGGVGINLMAADTVIIFDSDWNPMNDLQAIARAHRIGQKRQVTVYRLVTRNCYEQDMYRRADQKRALNRVVMGKAVEHTKKQIDQMLRRGAVAIILDKQQEQEIQNFENASIEHILSTRTERIVHNHSSEGSLFSQAVFVADQKDAKYDINDANFWDMIGIRTKGPAKLEARRRRTRVNYSEHEYFRLALNTKRSRKAAEDDDYVVEVEPNEEPWGVIRGIQQYMWGEWSNIQKFLIADERRNLSNGKNIRCGALQTLAFMILYTEGSKAWLNTPMCASLVVDEDLNMHLDQAIRRSLSDVKMDAELSKGDQFFERCRNVPTDLIDTHDLEFRQIPSMRMDTFRHNVARMFTLKSALLCVGNDLMSLKLEDVTLTKKLPKWWNDECDRFLIQGSLLYGWGNYSQSLAGKDGLEALVLKRITVYNKEHDEQVPKDFKWLTTVAQWNRFSSICVILKKQIRSINQSKRKELRIAQKQAKQAKQKKAVLRRKRERDDLTRKRQEEKKTQKKIRKLERERLKKQRAKEQKASATISLSKTQKVLSIGKIDLHHSLHCRKHIFPLGFTAKILAPSTLKKEENTWYTVKIAKARPLRFQISADDREEWQVSAPSANEAWDELKRQTISPCDTLSGLEQMGFTHSKIRKAIESLPLAKQCTKYVFKYKTFRKGSRIQPPRGLFMVSQDFQDLENEKLPLLEKLRPRRSAKEPRMF